MRIKFKPTGNISEVPVEIFQEHLVHGIDNYEFVDGTEQEKKLFNKELQPEQEGKAKFLIQEPEQLQTKPTKPTKKGK